jgi:hypothetical protein
MVLANVWLTSYGYVFSMVYALWKAAADVKE